MGPDKAGFWMVFSLGLSIVVSLMSIVSIPIIALLKRKPKGDRREIQELSRKVSELELKVLERDNEVYELRKEISFVGKLLEERKEKEPAKPEIRITVQRGFM